jgi:hypothetical protein
MSFASDPETSAYYERRADEYDEWYEGTGVFATRDRPGWHDELACVVDILEALPPARTIDVACGTGFLTRPSASAFLPRPAAWPTSSSWWIRRCDLALSRRPGTSGC